MKAPQITRMVALMLSTLVIVFAGTIALLSFELPTKFAVALIAMMVFPFGAMLVKDLRRFLFAAAVFTLPLHIDANFMHRFEQQAGASTAGVSLTDIAILMLLLLWLVEIAVEEKPFMRFFWPVSVPLILYFEAAVLSMLWAPRLDLAFMEVFRMANLSLLYFVLINHIRSVRDLRLAVYMLMAAVALQGMISALQTAHGGRLGLDFLGEAPPDPDGDVSIWRVMGTLGHPNKLATFLEVLLLLPIAVFLWEESRLRRTAAVAVFLLGIAALIMTGTRGAWIGFAVGTLVFMAAALFNPRLSKGRMLKALAAVPLLLIVSSFALSDMLNQRLFGNDYGSAAGRIPMIKIALNIISAHPVGGVGINNYQVNMRDYNDAVESLRYSTISRPVHNMYLLVAGETGIIGLAAMTALMAAVMITLLQSFGSSLLSVSLTATAFFGGMTAFCLHGFVDKHPPGSTPLFYVVAAAAVAAYGIHRNAADAAQADHG